MPTNMPSKSVNDLIRVAKEAREKALAKHTGFRVGAALLAKSGKIYTGANIESDIPSSSVCADRAALYNALSAGEREFEKMVVVTETKTPTPCGACRQMLYEFCGEGLLVISATVKGEKEQHTIAELLPAPYKMER